MESILLFLLSMMIVMPACAQAEEPPAAVYGRWIDCGDLFQIQLISQPDLRRTQTGLIADGDMSYLTFRVGLRYRGTDVWKGFEPASFKVTEYYKGQTYTEYVLDAVMSGLIETDWSSPAFYAPITTVSPEINTILAFEVYPEVEGWNFSFSPIMRGNSTAECEVSFRLPKANVRDE